MPDDTELMAKKVRIVQTRTSPRKILRSPARRAGKNDRESAGAPPFVHFFTVK